MSSRDIRRVTSKSLSVRLGTKLRAVAKRNNRAIKSAISRKRTVWPRLREYLAYARMVSLRDRDDSTIRFPSFSEEYKILEHMRNNDSTIFDENCRVEQAFIQALHACFSVNTRLCLTTIRRQLIAQTNCKKWRNAYYNDCRLGLFDRNVPVVISVCSHREREEKMFGAFSREFGVKPIRLDASPILYAKYVIDKIDTTDSLEPRQLRSLGIRSLYYRRSYLLHMAIWIFINEKIFISNLLSVTAILHLGKDNDDSRIVLLVDKSLKLLLLLPTSVSLLIHGERKVMIHYK